MVILVVLVYTNILTPSVSLLPLLHTLDFPAEQQAQIQETPDSGGIPIVSDQKLPQGVFSDGPCPADLAHSQLLLLCYIDRRGGFGQVWTLDSHGGRYMLEGRM